MTDKHPHTRQTERDKKEQDMAGKWEKCPKCGNDKLKGFPCPRVGCKG